MKEVSLKFSCADATNISKVDQYIFLQKKKELLSRELLPEYIVM